MAPDYKNLHRLIEREEIDLNTLDKEKLIELVRWYNNALEEETNDALLTDLYQLTMDAVYVGNDMNGNAVFEYFIRKLPQDWGYFIAAGIEDAIDYATDLHFSKSDINYLRKQNLFSEDYLHFLRDMKFTGEIYTVPEGTPITAKTPIFQVRAPRTEAQYLESRLL